MQGVGIYPNRIGVGIESDGPGVVDRTKQSGEGWLGYGWELPQTVGGDLLPQQLFHTTTNFEDRDPDWNKVSPESGFGGCFCPQTHAWFLLLVEALEDGMSSPPSKRPPPWTLVDKDVVCCLLEFGICRVNNLEQVPKQVGHDEHVKVSNLVSCMHCWLSHEC